MGSDKPGFVQPNRLSVRWRQGNRTLMRIGLHSSRCFRACFTRRFYLSSSPAASLGVPHTVIFTADPDRISDDQARSIGTHPFFSEGTNVDFVRWRENGELQVRTWERGVGWTLACGTGACASAVAAAIFGLCPLPAQVRCPGGLLSVEQTEDQACLLSGPSQFIGRVEGRDCG